MFVGFLGAYAAGSTTVLSISQLPRLGVTASGRSPRSRLGSCGALLLPLGTRAYRARMMAKWIFIFGLLGPLIGLVLLPLVAMAFVDRRMRPAVHNFGEDTRTGFP